MDNTATTRYSVTTSANREDFVNRVSRSSSELAIFLLTPRLTSSKTGLDSEYLNEPAPILKILVSEDVSEFILVPNGPVFPNGRNLQGEDGFLSSHSYHCRWSKIGADSLIRSYCAPIAEISMMEHVREPVLIPS